MVRSLFSRVSNTDNSSSQTVDFICCVHCVYVVVWLVKEAVKFSSFVFVCVRAHMLSLYWRHVSALCPAAAGCVCVCQRGGSVAARAHHLPAADTFVSCQDSGPDLTLSQFIWPFPAHVLPEPRSELPLEDCDLGLTQ